MLRWWYVGDWRGREMSRLQGTGTRVRGRAVGTRGKDEGGITTRTGSREDDGSGKYDETPK